MPTQIQSADISANTIRFVTEENAIAGSGYMYINTNYNPIGFSNLFVHATIGVNTLEISPLQLSMDRSSSTLYINNNGTLLSVTSSGTPSIKKSSFGSPQDMCYASGNLLLYTVSPRVYSLDLVTSGVTAYAGDGNSSQDDYTGPAISGAMYAPNQVSFDNFGNLYISDFKKIRKVNSSGLMYTVVGATGLDHTFVENMNAQSFSPGDDFNGDFRDTAVNSSGILHFYTSDDLVLKLTPGGTLQRVAGIQGNPGYDGENVIATGSRVQAISYLEFDANDNLYLYNATLGRLLKIDPSGMMYTVAGNGTQAATSLANSTTGVATSASISVNGGIAIDSSSNIFLGSSWPDHRVRKVSSGVINTAYGNGSTPSAYGEYLYQSSYVPLPYISGTIANAEVRFCSISGNQVYVDASRLAISPLFIDKINVAYTTYETL